MQGSVFFSVAHLLNLEVDAIFFDTTSTYFETEAAEEEEEEEEEEEDEDGEERPLRRLGHSKDHRPDLPQVVIGLAVTREGIPVRIWIPGAGRVEFGLALSVPVGSRGGSSINLPRSIPPACPQHPRLCAARSQAFDARLTERN